MAQYHHDPQKQYNTQIYRNRDFKLVIRDDNASLDITNYTYVGKVINTLTDSIVATFTATKNIPLNKVTFSLTDTQTGALTAGSNYEYDIRETDDAGLDTQILWGYIPIYDTIS